MNKYTQHTPREMIEHLVCLLDVYPIGENIFEGRLALNPWKRVFGGQIIAQSLMAATKTVSHDRFCNSLHSYFLRPGDPSKLIQFRVIKDRDGRSFSSRRVEAIQDDKIIFTLSCTFQTQEKGLKHQAKMPDVPPPEGLKSRAELIKESLDTYPEKYHEYLLSPRPFVFKPVPMEANSGADATCQSYWFKAVDEVPDDKALNIAMLAYASDYTLLGASLKPYSVKWFDDRVQCTSLDHAIWFHDDFKADEWLLYVQNSPFAGSGRSLNHGIIYNRNGKIIANVMQEALIRIKE